MRWLGRVTSVSLGLGFPTVEKRLTRMFILTLVWVQVLIFYIYSGRESGNSFSLGSVWKQTCLLKITIPSLNCYSFPWQPWMAVWQSWGWPDKSRAWRSRVGLGRSTSRSLKFWVPGLLLLLTMWGLLEGSFRSDSLFGLWVIRAMIRPSTLPSRTDLYSEYS